MAILALSDDDMVDMLVLAGCSLNASPKKNWVEKSGGLPAYVCKVARAIKRKGRTTSAAIRLAIGTIRNWASGQKNVDADTRAKSVAALAAWEALKKKNAARKVGKKVKASNSSDDLVLLCVPSFNVDSVRTSWDRGPSKEMWPHLVKDSDGYVRSGWIEQLWSDFIIVTGDLEGDNQTHYYRVMFEVDYSTKEVEFGRPVEVKQSWDVVEDEDLDPSELDDEYGFSKTSDPVKVMLSIDLPKPEMTKFLK